MPRLLDTRLIGRDIADVATTSYGSNTAPGSLLQVARDGISMQIGPNSDLSYISKDAEQDRSGISLQQYLASSWTNITPGLFTQVYDVTYASGWFWAVGANGSAGVIASSPIVNTTGSSIVTAVWTEQPHNFTGPIFGITFENGVLVACGSNGQIGVYNGTAWNLVRNGGTASIYRIAYGHRKGWVAVGTATSVSTSAGVTFVSEDAQTWMDTAPALGVGVPIYGVAYGDGQFMAVGGAAGVATNHIATSENGMTWTTRTSSSPTSAHYAVAYGNNRWVVGGNNVIVHSGGGVTWNSVAAAGNIQSVIYGNGMFVCSSTIVYGSVNGQEFAVLDDSTGFTATAAGGCYGNGLFVVGSRAGQIIRSGTALETIGGAPGRDGRDGINGTPGSAQTVVTRNTSANEAITNSVQSYVYILNQAPTPGFLVTIVLNVPVNTSNTVERFFVNVRNPDTGAVTDQIAFGLGALGGQFRGGVGNGEPRFGIYLPIVHGPCLVEFYRFPNTSDWYYDIIYYDAGPPGSGE